MKALFLVAGLGSRYTSTSGSQHPKCLVKIGDGHLADFGLNIAVKLNVDKIVMVIGHKGEMVREVYGNAYKGVPISYAYQPERLGLVHAMACGREELGQDDFWLFLGDEVLLGADHYNLQKNFYDKRAFLLCGMVPTDQPELICKNYSLDFHPESFRIRQVQEKPQVPFNHFIGTGNCLFRHRIFDYIDHLPTDPRTGKRELAGLIQYAIAQGELALCQEFKLKYYNNVNTYQDFLDVEEKQRLYKE